MLVRTVLFEIHIGLAKDCVKVIEGAVSSCQQRPEALSFPWHNLFIGKVTIFFKIGIFKVMYSILFAAIFQ